MSHHIVMNFSVPPSAEDLFVIAHEQLENMPDELQENCEELTVQIEEFPDEATEADLELEDAYELLALYKAGKELSPGVEVKAANDDDIFTGLNRATQEKQRIECLVGKTWDHSSKLQQPQRGN